MLETFRKLALILTFGIVAATMVPDGAQANVVTKPVFAHKSGVVALRYVRIRSEKEAYDACHAWQDMSSHAWRCEGWYGSSCYRRSYVRYNNVYCYQDFHLSMGKKWWYCSRRKEWRWNGAALINQPIRPGSLTTKWKCHGGGPSLPS